MRGTEGVLPALASPGTLMISAAALRITSQIFFITCFFSLLRKATLGLPVRRGGVCLG